MSEKSTMNVTEHVIVTERKRHPNDVRYPCRGTHEVLDAGRKLLTFLYDDDPSQFDLLNEGKLVLDEEETAELYDSFQEEDVIGLGLFRPTGHPNAGFSSHMYTVEKIHADEDYMDCRNMFSHEIEEITFQDVSVALALGLAEILYRDEKPFGISNDIEWKVLVSEQADEEEEKTTPNTATTGVTQPSSAEEAESTKETVADMFSDLGVGNISSTNEDENPISEDVEQKTEVLPSADEARAALVERLDPKFFSKRQKLSYPQIQSLKAGDVIWVHATTNLGQLMKKGPLAVLSIDESVYTFTDALGEEHEIDIVEEWDSYAEHFMSGGGFYNLFEARDQHPKTESAASVGDDTEKLIKALGLDKKAEKQEKEVKEKEAQLRWPDCYFAFGWNDSTYCLVVCPKEHWDKNDSLSDGKKIKHLADQVGLKELMPCIYEYTADYNETSLRMLFKAFGCEEKKEMADKL